MKAVLIRISTQEIIKKANYPKSDITHIESLDIDLKWLLINRDERPTFDNLTQRIERVEEITTEAHPTYPAFNQYKISFNIITLTDAELDDIEDGEAETISQGHTEKGERLFIRCYSKIWRRKNKNRDAVNKLTQAEARSLMQWLQPTYLWLKCGNFHKAKTEINKASLQTNIDTLNVAGVTDTFEWFKTLIQDYFTNQYDL